ncbi:CbtB domain-containing protein [Alsobacter ponti]
MHAAQTSASVSTGIRSASATMQAVLALVFGIFIVGMVGFSHASTIHNAAHDVRHSAGFPCH